MHRRASWPPAIGRTGFAPGTIRKVPDECGDSQALGGCRFPPHLQGLTTKCGELLHRLPCRRSRVRVPSAAPRKAPLSRGFSRFQAARRAGPRAAGTTERSRTPAPNRQGCAQRGARSAADQASSAVRSLRVAGREDRRLDVRADEAHMSGKVSLFARRGSRRLAGRWPLHCELVAGPAGVRTGNLS
jgi:hypothetical protein